MPGGEHGPEAAGGDLSQPDNSTDVQQVLQQLNQAASALAMASGPVQGSAHDSSLEGGSARQAGEQAGSDGEAGEADARGAQCGVLAANARQALAVHGVLDPAAQSCTVPRPAASAAPEEGAAAAPAPAAAAAATVPVLAPVEQHPTEQLLQHLFCTMMPV